MVFGRDKAAATAAPQETEAERPVKVGGKGRPTPSRRESQARNKRPLIGAPPAPKGATRAERKAARQARNAVAREERVKARQAMADGDDRYLPARDKGPARRFARDYIDSRRNLGEYFLPIALFSLLLGVVNVPALRLFSLVLLYGFVLVIAVDSYLLRRRVQRAVDAKFEGRNVPGVAGSGTYGMMRALQFRRGRMPKPMVARGQKPS
ncbi:membrane protein [Kineosporia sp. NBRC 101677]|nr:membrane protein [Kineosporia sp. NBRC 101677]